MFLSFSVPIALSHPGFRDRQPTELGTAYKSAASLKCRPVSERVTCRLAVARHHVNDTTPVFVVTGNCATNT